MPKIGPESPPFVPPKGSLLNSPFSMNSTIARFNEKHHDRNVFIVTCVLLAQNIRSNSLVRTRNHFGSGTHQFWEFSSFVADLDVEEKPFVTPKLQMCSQ